MYRGSTWIIVYPNTHAPRRRPIYRCSHTPKLFIYREQLRHVRSSIPHHLRHRRIGWPGISCRDAAILKSNTPTMIRTKPPLIRRYRAMWKTRPYGGGRFQAVSSGYGPNCRCSRQEARPKDTVGREPSESPCGSRTLTLASKMRWNMRLSTPGNNKLWKFGLRTFNHGNCHNRLLACHLANPNNRTDLARGARIWKGLGGAGNASDPPTL